MAAIASINANQSGAFAAAISTLGADDTITYDASKKQLLVLTNTTGGSLTATIDGDGGTTVAVPGLGNVSVAAGIAIPVGAGLSVAVALNTISHYCKGVVHITGAATLNAAIVTSATDLTPLTRLPDLIFGDAEPVTIKFLSASGTYESFSGSGTHTLSISIGEASEMGAAAYFQTSSFSTITNGWSGRLSLTTSALRSAVTGYLADRPSATAQPLFLQIRVTDSDGNTETYSKQKILIGGSVSVATTADDTPVTFASYADVVASQVAAAASAAAAVVSQSAAAASASTASTQASNASASAVAAAASALAASNSATTAAGSATTAGTQATNAATSASTASTHKDAAAVSASASDASAGDAADSALSAAASAASAANVLSSIEDNFIVLTESSTGLTVTIGTDFSPVEITSPYPSVTFTLP